MGRLSELEFEFEEILGPSAKAVGLVIKIALIALVLGGIGLRGYHFWQRLSGPVWNWYLQQDTDHMWYIAAGILFLIVLMLLAMRYVLDRRFLRKKTSEAMGRDLWNEIKEEREDSARRRGSFQAALKDAKRPHDDTVS